MSKFTKKFDRAFQWAGEKMGNEARTGTTEEFKMLETEMALRFDGESLAHSVGRCTSAQGQAHARVTNGS